MSFYLLGSDGGIRGKFQRSDPENPQVVALPDDDPRVVAFVAAQAKALIPNSCTKLGLMRAFKALNLWDLVRAQIAADPDVQDEWDLATEVRRTDPIVQGVQAAMRLSDDQVTQIIAAAVDAVA